MAAGSQSYKQLTNATLLLARGMQLQNMDKSAFRNKRKMKPLWGHMWSALSSSEILRQERHEAPGAGPVEGDKDD